MKTKIIIIGLAALLMAGCYTPSSQMNKVQIGMSESDVIKVLGKPQGYGHDKDGGETLYYLMFEGLGMQGPASYSVHLTNGKVDSYGRESGGTRSQPEPMPVIVPVVH